MDMKYVRGWKWQHHILQIQYLRIHCLGHVVVCIVGVFPGEKDDFTGTISKQLQVLWGAGDWTIDR